MHSVHVFYFYYVSYYYFILLITYFVFVYSDSYLLLNFHIALIPTLYCLNGVKTKVLFICINYCHFMLSILFNATNIFTLFVYHTFFICLYINHMLLIVLIKLYYTNYRRENKGIIHMLNHNTISCISYHAYHIMHTTSHIHSHMNTLFLCIVIFLIRSLIHI